MVELLLLEQPNDKSSKVEGSSITSAHLSGSQDGRGFEINFSFNSQGAHQWKRMTKFAASAEPHKRIAILLDKRCYSAPMVMAEIPNGNCVISGNFTEAEAKDLTNIIKAGSYPLPLLIVSERVLEKPKK